MEENSAIESWHLELAPVGQFWFLLVNESVTLWDAPTLATFFAVAGEPIVVSPSLPLLPAATRTRKSWLANMKSSQERDVAVYVGVLEPQLFV